MFICSFLILCAVLPRALVDQCPCQLSFFNLCWNLKILLRFSYAYFNCVQLSRFSVVIFFMSKLLCYLRLSRPWFAFHGVDVARKWLLWSSWPAYQSHCFIPNLSSGQDIIDLVLLHMNVAAVFIDSRHTRQTARFENTIEVEIKYMLQISVV